MERRNELAATFLGLRQLAVGLAEAIGPGAIFYLMLLAAPVAAGALFL